MHLVVDLETLGLEHNAAIVAIGAAVVAGPVVAGPSASWKINAAEAQANGGTVTASTLEWWARQSAEARKELEGTGTTAAALVALSEFAAAQGFDDDSRIWGKGPSFDCVILRAAYLRVGLTPFWKFWQERDVRTALDLVPSAAYSEFEGTPHNAEDDARHEARQVGFAIKRLDAFGLRGW